MKFVDIVALKIKRNENTHTTNDNISPSSYARGRNCNATRSILFVT